MSSVGEACPRAPRVFVSGEDSDAAAAVAVPGAAWPRANDDGQEVHTRTTFTAMSAPWGWEGVMDDGATGADVENESASHGGRWPRRSNQHSKPYVSVEG